MHVPACVCLITEVHCALRPGSIFQVIQGPCATDGNCFTSPNYPANYGSDQQCTITAHEAVTLSVVAFNVEEEDSDSICSWDLLTVNGVKYCGTTGPEGVQVAANATITFTSDDTVQRAGFEICGASRLNVTNPREVCSARFLTDFRNY